MRLRGSSGSNTGSEVLEDPEDAVGSGELPSAIHSPTKITEATRAPRPHFNKAGLLRFGADATSGCVPLSVSFTDLSTGTGIDGWSWDAPFSKTRERWLESRDPKIIWEGHYAGIDTPYCHMEKLRHLEDLPPFGFTVACFPCKIKAASGGWTRAVAMFD